MKENKRLIIGIVICVIVLIIFIIVGFSMKNDNEIKGASEEKLGTLYKFNTEEFNYKLLGTLFYNIKYTGKYKGIKIETNAMFQLNTDLSCTYTANIKYENGNSNSVLQNECSYVITDENDLLLNAKVRNNFYDAKVDKLTTTNEDMNINGKFSDDYKTLTIEKLKYTNTDYSMLLDRNINEFLFDATAKHLYDIDGNELLGSEDDYIKLDLTYFDIKTDSISNVYEGMLSNKFFGIKYIKDIKVNKINKLLNDNKYSVLYISQDECAFCDDLEDELLKVIPYYQIYINRINFSTLSSDDANTVKSFIFDTAGLIDFSTPTILIIGNKGVKDHFVGSQKNNYIRNFFRKNGFIND